MTTRNFIVATAGHVDHGKSALVKALTGTDPDRLPEEKARGITIDLGFAHLELPAPAGSQNPATLDPQPSTFHLGIVDVPGHEDFVKNMVAGVGSIDLALLVVAADDGWMPQTEEHLQILTYFGIRRGIIALTKIDLVESNESSVVASLRENLRGTPFAGAPIVPTSVVNGRGLADLKAALVGALAEAPPSRDIGKARLPVDRVFILRGIGTVVTGTLSGGTLRRGQAVIIQPSGKTARIRSLQNYQQDVEASGPGTRTALNLPDVEGAAQSTQRADGVRRGDVITLAELGGASDTLEVVLDKSSRLIGTKTGAARPLKEGTLVRVHLGSGNFPARVQLQSGPELLAGQRCLAQLRAEAPVFAFVGDRFIVRDWSEQATLAGGIILEADASRKNFRSEARQTFLRQRAESPDAVGALIRSQLERDHAVRRSVLLRKSRFSAAEISNAVERLVLEGQAMAAGEWVAEKTWWQRTWQRAADAIDAEHSAHPERAGLALSELRPALEKDLPAAELFEVLLVELGRAGFVQAGVAIRRAAHRPSLPPQLQSAGAKLRAALSAKPFGPPSRKELAPDGVTQQALRFLLQTGEAVELGEEVVLLTESFTRMKEAIVKFIRENGPATVSDLRQSLGTTRRIAMPLLERLDRDGITLRQEEKRVLRQKI